MKFIYCVATSALAMLITGTATAQTTLVPQDIQVTVQVVPSCVFSTTSTRLANYDPVKSGGAGAYNGSAVIVRCTAGTSWEAEADLGMNSSNSVRRMKRDGGTETLAYTLYQMVNSTPVTWGPGSPMRGTSTSSLIESNAAVLADLGPDPNAPVGTYRDVVKVTLRY